jgi:hypothetical protein
MVSAMARPNGFGKTWLTNWRRASEVPRRTIVTAFLVTSVGAGMGDYYLTSLRSVPFSTVLGLTCGLIVTYQVRRNLSGGE